MTNPSTPSAEMQRLLDEIELRVGVEGSIANDPSWDYRDIWLSRCLAYIRTLEEKVKILRMICDADTAIFDGTMKFLSSISLHD